MKHILLTLLSLATFATAAPLVYEGTEGPGKGKHIVFMADDHEYRSEESLPQLARILAKHQGFKCTVLFGIDPESGEIVAGDKSNMPGIEALDTADLAVVFLRFQNFPPEQMKHFDDYLKRGGPVVGMRTATHAFNMDANSTYGAWAWNNAEGGFGRLVLGETWVSHWGKHRAEATKGVLETSAKDHPVLRGVTELFGTTDVYEAAPPADSMILARGQVLSGMEPTSAPADYRKATQAGVEQAVNEPMMPIAWTREVKNASGKTNKILCTTMGAASDLTNESLRRLVINGLHWGLGLEVPAAANVNYVGGYKPLMYGTKDSADLTDPHGFRAFRRGVKPTDLK
jgi:hypothetical protein